jgi:hypothetical protein
MRHRDEEDGKCGQDIDQRMVSTVGRGMLLKVT